MKRKISVLLSTILILVPTMVFAEDESYNAISNVSKTLLNILSWVGYVVAMRNANNDGHKIYTKWSKWESKFKRYICKIRNRNNFNSNGIMISLVRYW